MSPCRIPERESGDKQPITPETEAYLRQSDYAYDSDRVMPTRPTPSPPSTEKFDESWPSTDKPSTLRYEIDVARLFLMMWHSSRTTIMTDYTGSSLQNAIGRLLSEFLE